MRVLVQLFWRVCTFNAGPASVPYRPWLMYGFLGLYGVIGFSQALAVWPVYSAFIYNLIASAIYVAFVYGVLRLFGKPERFIQTMTALLGCQLLLIIGFVLPLWFFVQWVFPSPVATWWHSMISIVYMVAMFFLGGWWLGIVAFILSEAINEKLFVGLAIVIMYKIFEVTVLASLW